MKFKSYFTKVTEGAELPPTDAIKIQNLSSLITAPFALDREFFGYADCKKHLLIFLLDVIMVAISNQFINIMARSKRIALSVDPEYHELLTKLADYQKKTVTGVITDFLEASRPAAEAMLVAFQELEKGVDQTEILKTF